MRISRGAPAVLAALAVACNIGSLSRPPPAVDDSAPAARNAGREVRREAPQARNEFPTARTEFPTARNVVPQGRAPEARSGLSGRQKLVMLGGASALYYLYKHHQGANAPAGEPPYYLSNNGRVYYRDSDHRAHWVTPPEEGIQVPASEAREYQDYQGYGGRETGRDLSGLAADSNDG